MPDSGKDLVRVDTRYFRPTEVDDLLGDASKAARALGWHPAITSFRELVGRDGAIGFGGHLAGGLAQGPRHLLVSSLRVSSCRAL